MDKNIMPMKVPPQKISLQGCGHEGTNILLSFEIKMN